MLVSKDCLDLKLSKTLQGGDNVLSVSGSDALKLNSIGIGNYINLTVTDNRACETVRYDHVVDFPATGTVKSIPVLRDVGATGRRNFGVHSCVVADWSVTQVVELINQLLGGVTPVISTNELPFTIQTELPTKVYGDRTALLGKPDGVLILAGKKIPYYN